MNQVFDTYLGIVPGEDSVSVGIIDTITQKISSTILSVNQFNPVAQTHDIHTIVNFIDQNTRDPRTVQVVVEMPEIFPYPRGDSNSPPCAVLDKDSPILNLLFLLATKYYIALSNRFYEEQGKYLLNHIPTGAKDEHLKSREPRYIGLDIAKTLIELLVGRCPTSNHAAVGAALIAKNKGAYYYWSSFGSVQSSQDVFFFLSHPRRPNCTGVLSASEQYITKSFKTTKKDKLEEIPLEYALACQKYGHLRKHDSYKAALFHVCKLWGIVLECASSRDDVYGKQDTYGRAVYPLAPGNDWIIDMLQQPSL